jgi:hypothetical protein
MSTMITVSSIHTRSYVIIFLYLNSELTRTEYGSGYGIKCKAQLGSYPLATHLRTKDRILHKKKKQIKHQKELDLKISVLLCDCHLSNFKVALSNNSPRQSLQSVKNIQDSQLFAIL